MTRWTELHFSSKTAQGHVFGGPAQKYFCPILLKAIILCWLDSKDNILVLIPPIRSIFFPTYPVPCLGGRNQPKGWEGAAVSPPPPLRSNRRLKDYSSSLGQGWLSSSDRKHDAIGGRRTKTLLVNLFLETSFNQRFFHLYIGRSNRDSSKFASAYSEKDATEKKITLHSTQFREENNSYCFC